MTLTKPKWSMKKISYFANCTQNPLTHGRWNLATFCIRLTKGEKSQAKLQNSAKKCLDPN